MNSLIREAKLSDLDSIVFVFRECWNISYSDLLPAVVREEMTVEAATKLWEPALEAHPDRKTLVLEVESEIVGMARIGNDPNSNNRGHLFSLYISPRMAGKGFGSELLNKALNELNALGFKEFSLWVFKDNERAKTLYKKLGYEESGVERTDVRWQIPEIEMISTTSNS